jgi:hypothetical protein
MVHRAANFKFVHGQNSVLLLLLLRLRTAGVGMSARNGCRGVDVVEAKHGRHLSKRLPQPQQRAILVRQITLLRLNCVLQAYHHERGLL